MYGDDSCVDDERAVNIKRGAKFIRKSHFIFRGKERARGGKISNILKIFNFRKKSQKLKFDKKVISKIPSATLGLHFLLQNLPHQR